MKYFNRQLMGKLVSYFKGKLGVTPHATGWLRQGQCPECGKEKKFGINLWLNRSNCFSCSYHPKPLDLIIKLEGLSTYNEVYSLLEAFEGVEYLETNLPILKEKPATLPESFRLLSLGQSYVANMARSYMRKRGYNITSLTLKGVGYCVKGPYAFRIIIPFYEKGRLIYFNARQFIEVGEKHKNPSKTEFGIGKSLIIYNKDALYLYNTAYLTESVTNALTMGDRGFAVGGKLVSEYQMGAIINSPCKRIVILLDPDAYWEALHTGLQLVKHKQIKVVKFPMSYKGKEKPDVNDLGKKFVLSLIKQTPWQSYKELYKLFLITPKPLHKLPVA